MSVIAASQMVRFVVTGAQGKGNVGQTSVANAMDAKRELSGCDYIVGVGNNIYDSGASSTSDLQFTDKFVTPYAGIDLPFWFGLGNHDYGGNGAGTDFPKAVNEINYSAVNPKWKMPVHYSDPLPERHARLRLRRDPRPPDDSGLHRHERYATFHAHDHALEREAQAVDDAGNRP